MLSKSLWVGVIASAIAFALSDSASGEPFYELSPRLQVEYLREVERSEPLWMTFLVTNGPVDLAKAYIAIGPRTLHQTRSIRGNPPTGWLSERPVYLGVTLDLDDFPPLMYVIPGHQEDDEDFALTTIHESCHAYEFVEFGEASDHGTPWKACMQRFGVEDPQAVKRH